MKPLQAEIYNLAAAANGLTSGQLHQRATLPLDRKETVRVVHEMVADGLLIGMSVDGQRRYIAATKEHKAALAADVQRKAIVAGTVTQEAEESPPPPPPAPPPPRDIKGRKAEAPKVKPKAPKNQPRPPAEPQPAARSKPVFAHDLEQEAERARALLLRYLDNLKDPVLQALINAVQELESAVEAAQERAA